MSSFISNLFAHVQYAKTLLLTSTLEINVLSVHYTLAFRLIHLYTVSLMKMSTNLCNFNFCVLIIIRYICPDPRG